MKRQKKWRLLSKKEQNVAHEFEHIIERAQRHDSRVVRWGSLVFFSTETGDAWILDPEDNLALCPARDGARQEFRVEETGGSFQIARNAHYQIDGDIFTVFKADGGMRSVYGYPTSEIEGM